MTGETSLARWGDGHIASDLFYQLAKQIEICPFLDVQGFEAVLDQLHVQAFPDATARPTRPTAGDLIDPRE